MRLSFVGLVVLFVVSGCAPALVERAADPLPAGGQAITIEMSGFTFISRMW